MAKKSYPGINIQWPISELILSGEKKVETRTYPIPEKYLNKEMLLIETPGPKGNFKARIRGIIIFNKCFQYDSKIAFYKDVERHCVTPDSRWAWTSKPKWGWEIVLKKVFNIPMQPKRRFGIRYSTDIEIMQQPYASDPSN